MLVNLFTSHGTIVGIDPSTGRLSHGEASKVVPLVGMSNIQGGYFFVSRDGLDFEIDLGGCKRRVGIFHVAASITAQSSISICDKLTEKFMSAEPGGACVVNRPKAYDWEMFRTSPIKEQNMLDAYRQRILRLSVWTEDAWMDLFQLKDAVEMAAGCLIGENLRNYLSEVEKDPRFETWQALLGAGDPWLDANSAPLDTWMTGGRGRSFISHRDWLARPEYDYLASSVPEGQFSSPGHVAATYRRSLVAPQRKCCIVTTVRNEGVYLIDWISYHKSIGIEQIFIYSNDNDDGSDTLLEALNAAGEIIWLRNVVHGGTSPQYKAYGHAFGIQPDILDFEWALLIDLDEYLVIEPGKFDGVGQFLDWQQGLGATSIMLTWQVIGSSGEATWEDRPVPERFSDQQTREPTLTKCFTKPNITTHSHCHFPWISRMVATRCLDARGNSVPEFEDSKNYSAPSVIARATRKGPILENAWINHYWYKSTEEFLARRTYAGGGESVVNNPNIPPVFAAHFAGQEMGASDNAILHYSSGMHDYRNNILSNAEIRLAHEHVCKQYSVVLRDKIKSNALSDDASVRLLVEQVQAAKKSNASP